MARCNMIKLKLMNDGSVQWRELSSVVPYALRIVAEHAKRKRIWI